MAKYSVTFRITSVVEVDAADDEEAWEKVEKMFAEARTMSVSIYPRDINAADD